MIKLIKSYPYDNKYDYVKGFSTTIAQDTYFNSLASITIDETNYIKVNNSFNVNYEFDDLVNDGVNYVIFNNGFRDIYAFVIQKEYVRKNVTRLIYEVDVFQTFMFDFSVGNSFIERKVCTLDEITEYDEGLYLGEHKIISDTVAFEKGTQYFAMFSGIKNFEVAMTTEGKISYYAEIPSDLQKPQTLIDGVPYPLFFVPLLFGFLPLGLVDHPSLVGIVRFPSCNYETNNVTIPYLRKIDGAYVSADQVTQVATTITKIDKSGSGGSVAKTEVTDFFPYTFYVLTDGETEPLIMKPQELTGLNVIGKFALSHQPIERYYVEGYKGDTSGKVYNITNTNQMMLPTGSSEAMAYISANGGMLKMQRDNQVMDNILNGVSMGVGAFMAGGMTLGGGLLAGGMGLAQGGAGSIMSGINQVREADQRNQSMMLTPNSISSYGTPSTRSSFATNSVRVLKYTVSDNVKNKIRNYILRFGNKFNNYATIDLKSYNGFIKYVMPNINSSIDNIYINKIIEILERGVYIE